MKRRLPREYAFKTLFMIDIGGNDPAGALRYLLEETAFSEKEKLFCRTLVEGVQAKKEELDRILSRYLIKWQFSRLAATVRSILRLALYELLYLEDVPPAVAINEAIELAKAYQDAEAARFVNGILDAIQQQGEKNKIPGK